VKRILSSSIRGIACILAIAGLPAIPALLAAAPGQEPATVPSVLLITLDTTRADHIGCYGAKNAATPNLDRLAAGGVLFGNALSPAPLTLPSHTSLFSGQVPRLHGARDNLNFTVDRSIPLLAERLSSAGWSTGAWVGSVVLDRSTGLDRGFERYDDTVRIGERTAFDYRERAAGHVVDGVLKDLPGFNPPFFLWVHLFDPHLPYVPPEPFRSRFRGRPYDGEIAYMDHEIGRLLGAVKRKSGPLLVVVAGDHGESLGEHDEDGHGVFVYNATQRVPLIRRWIVPSAWWIWPRRSSTCWTSRRWNEETADRWRRFLWWIPEADHHGTSTTSWNRCMAGSHMVGNRSGRW